MKTINRLHALRAALALICLIFVASCASRQEPPPEPAPQVAPAPPPPAPHASHSTTKQVRASFMGTKPAGRPTASGEAYDPNDLTAASKTFPLGSTVEVTNPSNGRSVRVRINDRGPFVRGRSIDLSKRAAEEIGLTEKGVGRVKIRRVDSKPAAHATPGLSEAHRSKPSESSGSEQPPLAPGVTAISTSASPSASSANSDR